ncbi:MAG: hypothetical protein AMXMBFR33_26830 [Candidatus Xenobia bacterium]
MHLVLGLGIQATRPVKIAPLGLRPETHRQRDRQEKAKDPDTQGASPRPGWCYSHSDKIRRTRAPASHGMSLPC